VLEEYCEAYVSVLRQDCQVFRREFIQIGQVEVFLESMTIASACNNVLRRLFLKPDTIGLIPKGGYSGNINYSKKAIMWLIYKQQTDNCKILHGRNGREDRLPELPRLSVDGYCPETKKCMNSMAVTIMDTHACHIVTRQQWDGTMIHSPSATNNDQTGTNHRLAMRWN
jgi:hypothetical protein